MQQVTPDEAKARLTELIAAALRGERVVIAEDDQHAVQLVPTSGHILVALEPRVA